MMAINLSDGISVAEQTDAPDLLLNTYREFCGVCYWFCFTNAGFCNPKGQICKLRFGDGTRQRREWSTALGVLIW